VPHDSHRERSDLPVGARPLPLMSFDGNVDIITSNVCPGLGGASRHSPS